MITKGLVVAFTLLASVPAMSATVLYSEDFSGQNGKGITGGALPTTNLSDVTWGLDASAASLTADTDWARVRNGAFEARDTDGPVVWSTPLINIADFSNVAFALDAIEDGDHEASDYFDVSYSLDGLAPVTLTDWNGLGNGSHTLTGDTPGDEDWVLTTLSLGGLLGDSLQLFVTLQNNAGNEYLSLDNVAVTGELSPVLLPLPDTAGLWAAAILGAGAARRYRKRTR